jgi:hypothetical protein
MECVKCGLKTDDAQPNCRHCTWPNSDAGWGSTTFKIKKVTLDTGCINAKQQDSALNTIERWAASGDLELQRSDTFLKEFSGPQAHVDKATDIDPFPRLATFGVSTFDGGDVLAGPDLGLEIKRILFPTVAHLNSNQQNDVEHLRQHVRTGLDVFLTKNVNDFIRGGKQETLRKRGIWVYTPDELVVRLGALSGWT